MDAGRRVIRGLDGPAGVSQAREAGVTITSPGTGHLTGRLLWLSRIDIPWGEQMRSESTPGGGPDTVIAGRYRLRRQIGRGGMGVVWEALDTSLNRKVAVKGLLHPGALGPGAQAEWVSRARREAQAIARIGHQNVVAVHDVIEDENQVWIVMELLNSRSLADLLREQRQLSVPHAARIGLQVLRGLAAVHESGVLHRDVKPHNILFRPDGHALLMDFGIATFEGAAQVTRSHEIIGTPQYLAPELLSHTPADPHPASTASDLWALGVTLYEMVEGRRPFDGATSFEALIAVRESPLPPMRYAGPLTGLIEALLRKDPDQRPDAAEAERMLQAVTDDVAALDTSVAMPGGPARPNRAETAGPVRSVPVRGGLRPAGSGGRRGRWKVAVAVVCAALLASAGWLTWRNLENAAGSDKEAEHKSGEHRFRADHKVLKVGVKKDQHGLSEGSDGAYKGFEPDLAKAIAREMGFKDIQVEFVDVNSNNRADSLKSGDVDLVLATYSISAKREKKDNVKFAGPYFKVLKGLLVRKNRGYKDLTDLQGKPRAKVCTARDSVYQDWLVKEKMKDRMTLRNGYEDCVLKELLNSKSPVDAVATDDVIVAGLAEEHPGTERLESYGSAESYGVAMTKSNEDLHREVCTALSAIMAKAPDKPSDSESEWAGLYNDNLRQIMHRSAPEEPKLTSC